MPVSSMKELAEVKVMPPPALSATKNIIADQGEVAYKETINGVTLSGKLPTGTYTQMRFYYYTNHDCMYNKSNITYSIVFDF